MSRDFSRSLGRLPAPDARDRRFPLSLITPKVVAVQTRYWRCGSVLDQGDTSQCVAYAWSQFLQSEPTMTQLPSSSYPAELYHSAQLLDEFAGEDYDGTSVRGGVKALQEQGRIASYLWSRRADEVRRFVLSQGIVVMGTDWYSSMFEPERTNNFLIPRGSIEGGHAWLITGYSQQRAAFRMCNSWGVAWGDHGHAWIRLTDLDKLLKPADAEACSATELAIAPLPQTAAD